MVVASTFAMASVGGPEKGEKKEEVLTSALTTTGLAPKDKRKTCAVYPLQGRLFGVTYHQRNVLSRVASR